MSKNPSNSNTNRLLNEVSPSFCLAKWLQVTTHLQSGFTHSCHHPRAHKIPLTELAKFPDSLHNTNKKIATRQEMVDGKRPSECSYCWDVEDSSGPEQSDRILKSSSLWAKDYLSKGRQLSNSMRPHPTYVEISFSSICNLKCAYCLPSISSSLWKEYERFGPFIGRPSLEELLEEGHSPPAINQPNPYLDAFWKWLPDILPTLRVLRVTGGEPLLDSNTFKLFGYLLENPQPALELAINSNLFVPKNKIDSLIGYAARLLKDKCVKEITVFTSMDTADLQAEYLRDGLLYSDWKKNIQFVRDNTQAKLVVMAAFNALSPPKFSELLQFILEEKRRPSALGATGISIDISHVVDPEYLSVMILPPKWMEKIKSLAQFMENSELHPTLPAFSRNEADKLMRIYLWGKDKAKNGESVAKNRIQFLGFTEQYKQRRNKAFSPIFPELQDLYEACQQDLLKAI